MGGVSGEMGGMGPISTGMVEGSLGKCVARNAEGSWGKKGQGEATVRDDAGIGLSLKVERVRFDAREEVTQVLSGRRQRPA